MIDRQAQLAKLELEDKASRLREAGGLIVAAIVVAVFAVGVLIAAAVLGLALVLPAWAAALVVGAVLVSVAVVLLLMGRARMRSMGSLAPTQTIEAAREDVAWIRRRPNGSGRRSSRDPGRDRRGAGEACRNTRRPALQG